MPANDRRSVLDSSKDYPFRRKNVSIHHSRWGRTVDADNVDDFPPSPPGAPPSGALVLARVDVSEYINIFCQSLDALQLPAMHQNGNRLDFAETR